MEGLDLKLALVFSPRDFCRCAKPSNLINGGKKLDE